MTIRTTLIFFMLFLLQHEINAQVPNDEKATATLLNVSDTNCEYVQFNFDGATASVGGLSCIDEEIDVWFKFEKPDSSVVNLSIENLTSVNNPYVYIEGIDDYCLGVFNASSGKVEFNFEGVTEFEESIYLRVFCQHDVNAEFQICIKAVDLSDDNMYCENAIEVIANDAVCDPAEWINDSLYFHQYNFVGDPPNFCINGSGGSWFSFDCPPEKLGIMSFSFEESIAGITAAVYREDCGLNAIEESCTYKNEAEILELFFENPSQDTIHYFVYLGATNYAYYEFQPFNVCATIFDAYPNEICDMATSLVYDPLSSNCEITFPIDLKTAWAHTSSSSNCKLTMKDLWFKYNVSQEANLQLSFDFDIEESGNTLLLELFEGNCDQLESIACITIGTSSINFKEPDFYFDELGKDYFFRIGLPRPDQADKLIHDLCFNFLPPAVNDDCANAIWITDQDINYPYNLDGSSPSEENIFTEFPDIWYKFIYTAENIQELKIIPEITFGFIALFDLYRGSCNDLVPVAQNTGFNNITYAIQNPDLVNDTFYIVVRKPHFHNIRNILDGNLFLNQVENDAETGAYCSLAWEGECNLELDNISNYNFSGIGDPCNLFAPRSDLWLKAKVPESGLVSLGYEYQTNNLLGSVFSLYKNTCEALEHVSCFDIAPGWNEKQLNLFHLKNQDIFFKFSPGTIDSASFTYCIEELMDWDVNEYDICSYSKTLNVVEDYCESVFLHDNFQASYSDINPDCAGYKGGDVWFNFTMPVSGKVIVYFEYISGSLFLDGVMKMYKGSCDQLISIACDDDSGLGNMPSISIDDPSLAGQDVFIQFYAFNNETQGSFGVCVFEPAPPSADFCNEAIFLAPLSSDVCLGDDGPIANFSGNGFSGNTPSCGINMSNDIWFTFKHEPEKQLVFQTKAIEGNPLFDGKAALYGGTCDSLIFISCNDDGGPGDMPSFDIQEVLIDHPFETENLFVQFWDVNTATTGTFNYCLYDKLADDVVETGLPEITIYPNPTNELLNLGFSTFTNEEIQIEIFSVEGKKLYQKTELQIFNQNLVIDVSQYTRAVYIIKVSDKVTSRYYNFVKQ